MINENEIGFSTLRQKDIDIIVKVLKSKFTAFNIINEKELEEALIINNNYSLVEDLPDKEKIIISGDGTESNPYATRDYPNYYEQGDFINDKYKEWNFKKYHRERNCMMCGTYYSTDYNNGSETNILREDI